MCQDQPRSWEIRGAISEVSFSPRDMGNVCGFQRLLWQSPREAKSLVADGWDGVHSCGLLLPTSLSPPPPTMSGVEQVGVRCIGLCWWGSATFQALRLPCFNLTFIQGLHPRGAS